MSTRFWLMACLFVLAASSATAQDTSVQAEPLQPIAGQKQTGEEKSAQPVQEEKAATAQEQAALLCQTTDIMGEVKGANYEPGVDAYGKVVAPADVSATPVYDIPERIDIPLDIAVLETLGVTPEPDLHTRVGTISILKGGEVLYNDQEMTSTVQAFCLKHNSNAVVEP